MDHQQPLNPILARLTLEISYLKREVAIIPKGRPIYTHAELLLAKIAMLNIAKELIIANNEPPDEPF
jgi:hypothetical protein